MTRRTIPGTTALVAAILTSAPREVLAQCALCRDALDAAAPQTRAAMNVAILALAFSPYFVAALAAVALSPSLRGRLRELGRRALGRPGPAS